MLILNTIVDLVFAGLDIGRGIFKVLVFALCAVWIGENPEAFNNVVRGILSTDFFFSIKEILLVAFSIYLLYNFAAIFVSGWSMIRRVLSRF